VLSDPTPYNVFIRCGLAATRLTDFKDGELMCAGFLCVPAVACFPCSMLVQSVTGLLLNNN